jgi:hypothetical protein
MYSLTELIRRRTPIGKSYTCAVSILASCGVCCQLLQMARATPIALLLFSLCALAPYAASALDVAPFSDARASSVYAGDSVHGSPRFDAARALDSSAGYWCSAGDHGAGAVEILEVSTAAASIAKGVYIDWVMGASETRVLVTPDGSNWHEAHPWTSNAVRGAAYGQWILFDEPQSVKAARLQMRNPSGEDFFAVVQIVLVEEPMQPFMLISGASSTSPQCVVADNLGIRAGTGVAYDICSAAIASGDGREIFHMNEDGQIVSVATGLCMARSDRGLSMQKCNSVRGNPTSYFEMTRDARLRVQGGYCVGGTGDAKTVDLARASGSKVTHSRSGASAGSAGVSVELETTSRIGEVAIVFSGSPPSSVKLEAQAGDIGFQEVSSDVSIEGGTYTYKGPPFSARRLRVSCASGCAIEDLQIHGYTLGVSLFDCDTPSGDITPGSAHMFMQKVSEFDQAPAQELMVQADVYSNKLKSLAATRTALDRLASPSSQCPTGSL